MKVRRIMFFLFLAGSILSFPKRIVILSSDFAETLIALGAGREIVGITRDAERNPFLPEEIKKLPKCGNWREIDLEKVISLSPSLVILEEHGNSERARKFLIRKGVTVLKLFPRDIYELCEAITVLAKAVGKEEKGEELKNFIVERVEKIERAVKGTRKIPVYLAGVNPYWTFAKGSVWASLISIAGGKNIAGKYQYPWPKISAEILVKWNPDVILIHPSAPYGPEWFLKNKQLRIIMAVKEGKVYKLGPYLSWSPRIILALEEIAKSIHPEKLGWLNLQKEKDELGKLTSLKY